tara:strand:- start:1422 stop:2138 length:717 start_codon:yes stop_codon:yes gene_type:complete
MKISVITTLYNYKRYIEDTIKSFLKQGFDDAEMIIIDDGSVDNPYKVIKRYESDRVRYVNLNSNNGYSYAKNVGIKTARADILVMLDADDMLTDNSLRVRYKKLKEGFDLVHGPVLDLKSSGETVPSGVWKKWKKCKKDASCYRYIHAQSVMLRKKIHSKIGLYDVSLRSKSDREFWARVLHYRFKIANVNDYVAIYRKHSKQMHRSAEKAAMNDKLQKRVLKLIEKRKRDLSGLEIL